MSGHLETILSYVGVMLQPSWCQEASHGEKLKISMDLTPQGELQGRLTDGGGRPLPAQFFPHYPSKV
eukprot:12407330-Karenia_brevis.AAC.1